MWHLGNYPKRKHKLKNKWRVHSCQDMIKHLCRQKYNRKIGIEGMLICILNIVLPHSPLLTWLLEWRSKDKTSNGITYRNGFARSPYREIQSWRAPHRFTKVSVGFLIFHSVMWVNGQWSSDIWGKPVLEITETWTGW